MKKFYTLSGANAIDPKGVKEMYEDLKRLIFKIEEPAIRGLMSFLFLTGARINEVLPNPTYKTAVTFENLMPDESGIITLPLTEKKKQKPSLKDKRRGLEYKPVPRWAVIWDMDLWRVVIDYAYKYRKNWDSRLLRRTWFNPKRFREYILTQAVNPYNPHEQKAKRIFYKKWLWLFSTSNPQKIKPSYLNKKKSMKASLSALSKRWVIWKVVFPLSYNTIYHTYLKKLRYEAKLIDLEKGGVLVEGERGLYTHIGREFFVNYVLRVKSLNEYEVARVLNWTKTDNIQFYIRKDRELINRIAQKISVSDFIEKEENEELEKNSDIVEKIIERYRD